MPDAYSAVNATWPATLPPITRDEARRASHKLRRHFEPERKYPTPWVRRVWISTKPTSSHMRGWHRLVHDISHRVHSRQHPHFKDHGLTHAAIEARMVDYVIARGWLDGRLKTKPPTPRVKVAPTVDERHARVLDQIKRWETKRKRAETALKKLRRRERALDRRRAQVAA